MGVWNFFHDKYLLGFNVLVEIDGGFAPGEGLKLRELCQGGERVIIHWLINNLHNDCYKYLSWVEV